MVATSLHVEVSGTGAPVVLLHSSGLSGRQWRRLTSDLAARGFQVVVPDLTGHGRSPACPEPTPHGYRDEVAAVTGLLAGLHGAHVVGHSYGGLVALLAALELPSAVRSLVLFEPVAFGVLDPVADARALVELEAVDVPWGATAAEHDRWLESFVDYWGGSGAWAALRDDARAEFRRVGWAVHEGVVTLMADSTPSSAYGAITCPVTLITGESSPLAARRVVERLREAIPAARQVTLDGVGHMAPLADADRVNAVIRAALEAT